MDQAEKLAEVVLRQGELKLGAQMQLALASDTRATALAGIFTAAGLAAFGGVVTLWELGKYEAVLWGLIPQTIALLAAAFLCAWASRPVDFYTVGNRPRKWWTDNVESKPLAESLRKEADNYQNNIDLNTATIADSARHITRALYLATLSPIAFLVGYAGRTWFS